MTLSLSGQARVQRPASGSRALPGPRAPAHPSPGGPVAARQCFEPASCRRTAVGDARLISAHLTFGQFALWALTSKRLCKLLKPPEKFLCLRIKVKMGCVYNNDELSPPQGDPLTKKSDILKKTHSVLVQMLESKPLYDGASQPEGLSSDSGCDSDDDPTMTCRCDSDDGDECSQGFFRRSIQQKIQYRPCTKNQQCSILRINRNRCQYCRLKKCIAVGMSRDGKDFQLLF